MLGTKPVTPDRLNRVGAIKEWSRECLALEDGATVMVSELRCTEDGCPPLETVIAVFAPDGGRLQLTVHKPLDGVTRGDVAAAAAAKGKAHHHEA